MALISPGVQVTVIDESNYTPAAAGTVPFILLATAQNKTTPLGSLAEYTTAGNAGRMFLVTSQRELINNYGIPEFLVTQGTPVHGHELNEYGLLAAYSALGVSNAAWIMRADVDLAQLTAAVLRPSGPPQNNTLWLDTELTRYGIFEWNTVTGFREINSKNTPGEGQLLIITDENQIAADLPLASLGKPGDYAVDSTSLDNPVFFKASSPSPVAEQWVAVGSEDWREAWPTVVGTVAGASIDVQNAGNLVINGSNVVVGSGANVSAVVANINTANIASVTAAVTNTGSRLALFTSAANISIADDQGSDLLTELGFVAGTYNSARFVAGRHTQAPAGGIWTATGTDPRPTGSVWFKTTIPNSGARFVVKRYNAVTGSWTESVAPVFESDAAAIHALDPAVGGVGIAANSLYVQSVVTSEASAASYSTWDDPEFSFKLFTRRPGVSRATGSVANPVFDVGSKSFTIRASVPGQPAMGSAVTVSFTGITADDFVQAVNNAGVSQVFAARESTGRVTISHAAGGVIELTPVSGQVLGFAGGNGIGLVTAGEYAAGSRQSDLNATGIWISNWQEAIYTVTSDTPAADPVDGTLWHHNAPLEYDILVNTGTAWVGYLNGGTDSRGFVLSNTNPTGPLVSASEPTEQSDGTALESGDLWVDISDLDTGIRIYRYNANLSEWTLLDNTDQTTENGILFADARWSTSASVDVITGDVASIPQLLTSNHLDPDCPSFALYPRGMLLFNTRRSGLNVKRFTVNHFADADPQPAYLHAWVSESGTDEQGAVYLGRRAQRAVVVRRMVQALSLSTEVTEETRNFNVMVAPGYPELTSALTQLNVNRKETAFILVDSPLRLAASSNTLDSWARNLNLSTENDERGFVSYYEYMAGYYPSGFTRNLDGTNVVVPASHMVLRTLIRSDQKSYPWFAPAGLRRGTVDNVNAIGYIDSGTGEFQSIAVDNRLRDVLYAGKVNPIAVLTGSGVVVYGQKTRSSIDSALDRVNVARLVVFLRRQLDLIARQYIFEPNDEITRRELKNQVERELLGIQSNRGIYDFAVVCDLSNNTPERIDRNELWVDVAIEPVKAAEFIYIPLRIKNTGDIEAGL